MEFRILKPRERIMASGFSIAIGFSLAVGFLAAARELAMAIVQRLPPLPPGLDQMGFPLLTAVFYYTLPRRRKRHALAPIRSLWLTGAAAVVIALIFGAVSPGNYFWMAIPWYVFAAPLGEELLFRGWLYEIADWLWPEKFFTATNPLPTAVCVTAGAFSVWHLQNLGIDPTLQVVWQMGYTLFTGLWLGWLRWRSGSLWVPFSMHASINVAAIIF